VIDRDRVLALYDAEMRQDPMVDPGTRVERVGPVVRVVGTENYVLFSRLTDANAREVIATQAEFFRRAGSEVEWKLYGHDTPANLALLLEAEGFVPDQPETLVVLDLGEDTARWPVPPGVEVRQVTDSTRFRDAIAANDAAFGPEGRDFAGRLKDRLSDPTLGLFVAYVDGVPASTGRVELPPGRSFAGLWGGGTAPKFRHRGIYRALVATRAEFARRRGYRFLTVDARETSRPILERLGFVPLTSTRGWILRARHESPKGLLGD
jgi:GNAT superfamily N-acetyltransferase